MKTLLKRFRRDESGATLVEYGAALAVVLIVGVTALGILGGTVSGIFTAADGLMQTAPGG